MDLARKVRWTKEAFAPTEDGPPEVSVCLNFPRVWLTGELYTFPRRMAHLSWGACECAPGFKDVPIQFKIFSCHLHGWRKQEPEQASPNPGDRNGFALLSSDGAISSLTQSLSGGLDNEFFSKSNEGLSNGGVGCRSFSVE